jgi:multidomain signaling protein FimX
VDDVLRLLVIEDDPNHAERLIRAVSSSDFAVRAQHVEDENKLAELLSDQPPDLMLCAVDAQSIDPERALTLARESGHQIAIICLANGAADPVEWMQKGAIDLVDKQNSEHLKLVVARSYEAQRQYREAKRLQAALQESERRCRTLLDSSRDSICYVHEGMHVYANPMYVSLFGYKEPADVEGTPIMDMVAPDHQGALKDCLRRLEKEPAEQRLNLDLKHVTGKTFTAELELNPANIDGESCVQIVIRDRSNVNQLARQLDYISQRDPVTGAYNRKHFIELLIMALSDASAEGRPRGLLQVELDNIASIKGTVGAAATDLVLADVARLLQNVCGEDVLARLGEHVFAILTPQHETKNLEAYARRLSDAISNHSCDVQGKSVQVQAHTVGVPIDGASDVDEALARADKTSALTRERRLPYAVYQPAKEDMTQKQQDEIWAARLRAALAEQRLRLVFQPIVSLRGDPGERYETFLRVLDPSGAEFKAAEFIPAAQRTAVAAELDRWVLNHAVGRLVAARAAGKNTSFVLKLSAATLQDPAFLPWLETLLRDQRVPPGSLALSAKVDAVIKCLKQAKALAKGLQELHCAFALDDFGTGQNPFQLLKAVPADYLKVHRGLMENITRSPENQDALRSLIDTSNAMGKVLIVQYVEDATALPVLWGLGANLIQGYFLQSPSETLDYDFSALA